MKYYNMFMNPKHINFDINITSASVDMPDVKFWSKLRNTLNEIQYLLENELSEKQKQYFEEEISRLQQILDDPNPKILLRSIQKKALEEIIWMLKLGIIQGYIKLPTWVGKTILFACIVQALEQSTIIQVPTVDLLEQTAQVFINDLNYSQLDVKVVNPSVSKNNVPEIVEEILKDIENREFTGIILVTWQALTSLYKNRPDLIIRLKNAVSVIVTDEAHRALWDLHISMTESGLKGEDADKLHLLFTATPKLGNKELKDYYQEIMSVSLQEAADEGILVIPQHAGVWDAILNLNRNEETRTDELTQKFLDKYSLKFIDQYWRPIYESLTDKYIEIKNNSPHKYAPWMAVCATIKQAVFLTDYLKKRWLRVVRVTSGNKEHDGWLDSEIAKYLLMVDQVDLVVTVNKVAEWRDVPTLRNIIRYYPTLSESRLIQSFGRILRVLEWKHIEYMINEMHKLGIHKNMDERELLEMLFKTRKHTNLIEPDSWQITYHAQKSLHGIQLKWGTEDDKNDSRPKTSFNLTNTIQTLYDTWELDQASIDHFFWSVKLKQKLPPLWENGLVEIENKIYQWINLLAPAIEYQGLTWQYIWDRVSQQSDEWKAKYLRKAYRLREVVVVEVEALKELLDETYKILSVGVVWEDQKIEIDGKIYQYIWANTAPEKLWWLNPQKAIKRLRKQSDERKQQNTKIIFANPWTKRSLVTVVEINALKTMLEDTLDMAVIWEENKVEIDWKIYQQVSIETPEDQLRGIKWRAVRGRINRNATDEWKRKYTRWVLSPKWPRLLVVEVNALKEFLKDVITLPKIWPDNTVDIDGEQYQFLWLHTKPQQLGGFQRARVQKLINKQSKERKEKNIKSAIWFKEKTLPVVKTNAILDIIKVFETYEIPIDGKISIKWKTYKHISNNWQWFLFGVNYNTINLIITSQSEEWHKLNSKTAILKWTNMEVKIYEWNGLCDVVITYNALTIPSINIWDISIDENDLVHINDKEYIAISLDADDPQSVLIKKKVSTKTLERRGKHCIYSAQHWKKMLFVENDALKQDTSKKFYSPRKSNKDLSLPMMNENDTVDVGGITYKYIKKEERYLEYGSLRWSLIVKELNNKWKERIKMNTIAAILSSGNIVTVYKKNALEDIFKDINEMPILENGKGEYKGKKYQWVWATTPQDQIRWINPSTALTLVKNASKDRKEKYAKRVLLFSSQWLVGLNKKFMAYEENALHQLLDDYIKLPSVWEDWIITISWVEYVDLNNNHIVKLLFWYERTALYRKIKSKSKEWQNQHSKYALKHGKKVAVYELSELKDLLKDRESLIEMWEKDSIMIEGKNYIWLWGENEIRWFMSWALKARINKQWNEWKKKYEKKVIWSRNNVTLVYEENALKDLIKDEIHLQEVDEDWRIEIEGKVYQWVWITTPINQLWGLSPSTVVSIVNKQWNEWKAKYVKEMLKSKQKVIVVEINALKELLDPVINIPQLWDNGTVEIEGKIYQWVWDLTPIEQVWHIDTRWLTEKIKVQSDERKENYCKKAWKRWPVNVVETKALYQMLIDWYKVDTILQPLWKDEKVNIENNTYFLLDKRSTMLSEKVEDINKLLKTVDKQSDQWKSDNLKKVLGKIPHLNKPVIKYVLIKEDALNQLFKK